MIRVERRGAIAALILARPERRNALTPEMLSELAAAITRLGESAGCVLLCGEGPVFCSGFDLSACRDSPDGAAKIPDQTSFNCNNTRDPAI